MSCALQVLLYLLGMKNFGSSFSGSASGSFLGFSAGGGYSRSTAKEQETEDHNLHEESYAGSIYYSTVPAASAYIAKTDLILTQEVLNDLKEIEISLMRSRSSLCGLCKGFLQRYSCYRHLIQ